MKAITISTWSRTDTSDWQRVVSQRINVEWLDCVQE